MKANIKARASGNIDHVMVAGVCEFIKTEYRAVPEWAEEEVKDNYLLEFTDMLETEDLPSAQIGIRGT